MLFHGHWLLFAACILCYSGCEQQAKTSSTESVANRNQKNVDSDREERLRNLLDFKTSLSLDNALLPRFRNLAYEPDSGIDFRRFSDATTTRLFLPEVMGGGVAWIDFDGDGLLDLYAVDGCRLWDSGPSNEYTNRLFRNLGQGRFLDVTAPSGAGEKRYGQGCAVGDFNADGFPDLYVTNYGRNSLLRGNGDGTFDDVTDLAGVDCDKWSTSAVWFDANHDELADLYTVNYLDVTRANHRSCNYEGRTGYCGPGGWDGVEDVIYLNRGDGRFQHVPVGEGIDETTAKGLAVAATDFDADGIAEVYVANDMAPNFLLRFKEEPGNVSRIVYQNVSVMAGCAVSNEGRNEASMGVACADFDSDGRIDIFLTHFYEAKNTLYRNLGGLLFEDASRRSRAAGTSFDKLGFGTVAFDADLDGDLDLFIANGHVLGPNLEPNEMTAQMLLNDGVGAFYDISAEVGGYFSRPCLGRGAAGGDFDNDGRLDLAVNHLDLPLAVLHNETSLEHHFIGLELLPVNRVHPSGGRVIVTTQTDERVVPVVAGGSYLSANDPRLIIGLGDLGGPVDVEVKWSAQRSDRYENLTPDRYWILPEGQDAISRANDG